jgi:hypothetical protein
VLHRPDGIHEIYRDWRRVAESYDNDRVLIGELWLPDHERFAAYLRPDELHAAFNFPFLSSAWDAAALRSCVDATLAAHAPVDANATWVLSNHDVTRHVTRYGRQDTTFEFGGKLFGAPSDLALGTRRARAAALLAMALPGGVYVYQGEELGLPEVEEEIPNHLRQDPVLPQVRLHGSGPRWLPRPDPVGRRCTAVRVLAAGRDHRPVAAAAAVVGPAHGRRRGRRPGVDADALPHRPADPAFASRVGCGCRRVAWRLHAANACLRPRSGLHLRRQPVAGIHRPATARGGVAHEHSAGDGRLPADAAVWLKT